MSQIMKRLNELAVILNDATNNSDKLSEAKADLNDIIAKFGDIPDGAARVDIMQDVINKINAIGEHTRLVNIATCLNGTVSISERSKNLKLPVTIPWRELMNEPNLAHFNSVDHSKRYVGLIVIDLDVTDEEKVA